MTDPSHTVTTPVKQDNTRIQVLEGEYKGHLYFADKFGFRVTYKGFRVINAQEGSATAAYTHEQRAKLAIDTLCDAYSISQ